MRLYIEQGRFGEFVEETISAENRRRTEQAEKEDEEKLWIAYVHSYSDKSYNDWKEEVLTPASHESTGAPRKRDDDMTNDDIDNLINRLFPATEPGRD